MDLLNTNSLLKPFFFFLDPRLPVSNVEPSKIENQYKRGIETKKDSSNPLIPP